MFCLFTFIGFNISLLFRISATFRFILWYYLHLSSKKGIGCAAKKIPFNLLFPLKVHTSMCKDFFSVSCQCHSNLLLHGKALSSWVLKIGYLGHDPLCADIHCDSSSWISHVWWQNHKWHFAVIWTRYICVDCSDTDCCEDIHHIPYPSLLWKVGVCFSCSFVAKLFSVASDNNVFFY